MLPFTHNRILDHSTRFISIETNAENDWNENERNFLVKPSNSSEFGNKLNILTNLQKINEEGQKQNQKNMFMVCWGSEFDSTAIRRIPLRNSIILNTISEKGPCLFIVSYIGAFEFLCSEDFPIEQWNRLLIQHGYTISKFWDLFRINKFIGSGSFSNVFVVNHTITGEQLIVKSVNKSKVKKSNIYTEIEILRSIDHPYIVKLNSAFEDEGKIFLILEYLKGGEMFTWISKFGCYNEEEAKNAIRRVLLALYRLHMDGIVHRDVKSENLMLEYPSHPSSTKLIDFGLASRLKSNNMRMRCGSPGYVAPEILLDQPYDSKVDIFSAGVTLFTMLAGYPPFTGQNVKETLRNNLKANIVFHKDHWKNFPHTVKDLILWMCSSEQQTRCSALQALTHTWFQNIPKGINTDTQHPHPVKSKRKKSTNNEDEAVVEFLNNKTNKNEVAHKNSTDTNKQNSSNNRRWSWNMGDFQ